MTPARRTSMTVAGQPQVTYSYDNANRLTQIAQGTSTVGFSFDNINRRSTLTLSNGVNMSYTYDNDSRVTGITYKFNAATLGNLAYSASKRFLHNAPGVPNVAIAGPGQAGRFLSGIACTIRGRQFCLTHPLPLLGLLFQQW
jgi:hypothetical protein